MLQYPVSKKAEQITSSLAENNTFILEAEPGAGKTTVVPLLIYKEAWNEKRKIIMLEPRRLAARNAAMRMSQLLGESLGQTVGYRIRGEHKISRHTRIEVVTEGILTRMLQADPELEDVACIIFDEFHERSLHADLGLALALDVQANLRDDLRIIVMSATLDTAGLKSIMPDAPVVHVEGRQFPVTISYAGDPYKQERLLSHSRNPVADSVLQSCENTNWKNTLVFLQGRKDIEGCFRLLTEKSPDEVDIYKLYGDLDMRTQQMAIEACTDARRKIVLATNIAETSITIQGIDLVIDTGLEKHVHYSPASGVNVMESRRISQGSAAQRSGRAGRTNEGHCIRLWDVNEKLIDHNDPEIMVSDLSSFVLSLAAWGVSSTTELLFIQHPSRGRFEQAVALLTQLDALDSCCRITEEGRRMEHWGIHPRFAHMLLRAQNTPAFETALELATLLHLQKHSRDTHLLKQLENIRDSKLFKTELENMRRRIGNHTSSAKHRAGFISIGCLLSWAYPDRVAKQLQPGRFKMFNGMEAVINENDELAKAEYLAIADIRSHAGTNYVEKAVPLTADDFIRQFEGDIKKRIRLELRNNRFFSIEEKHFGAIILHSKSDPHIDAEAFHNAVLLYLGDAERLTQTIENNKKLHSFYTKLQYYYGCTADESIMSDITINSLCNSLDIWLKPFLGGLSSSDPIDKIPMQDALINYIGYDRYRRMKTELPDVYEVPSGSKIKLIYTVNEVILKARIQELFGLFDGPRCAGKAVTIHLLSPAMRPVQITKDLKSFWENTYSEVKKELKGRYPKHYWPDNPYDAQAIRGVKPRQ